MKKQMIVCGLAAMCMLAYASSEKIVLTRNGQKVKSIRVESVKEIKYSAGEDGFDKINFNKKDGTVETYKFNWFDRMEYTAPMAENPMKIEVKPRHVCATLTISSPEGVYYRISGATLETLKDVDEGDWADFIIQNDMDYVQSVADCYGRPLSTFPISEICETGSQVRDWYPDEIIGDNTPVALVAYTTQLNGDKLEVTSEPRLIRFTTKKLVEEKIDFTINADLTSNTVKLKVDGVPDSIPFGIELYSKSDVETAGLDNLIYKSVNQYTAMVYNYGGKWSDYTFEGHGERTWTNKAVGEEYVAVAFGCEYGVVTTYPVTKDYVIPEPEITDKCTFDVETTQMTPAEMSLKITPSDPNTRYAAFLVAADRLTSTTPSKYVAHQIKWYNNMNTIRWTEDKYVFQGERTITTHEGVVDAEYLEADKDYYVFICGILPDGTRTTEIKEVKCRTSAAEQKHITFDIEFGKRRPSGSYALQPLIVKPSDKEAKYVAEHLPSTNYYADLSVSDEEFMKRYVDVQGQYLNLRTGDNEISMSFQKEWSNEANSYVWGKAIVFVFGYEGVITSDLYVYEVDLATGNATQLRGPGMKTE